MGRAAHAFAIAILLSAALCCSTPAIADQPVGAAKYQNDPLLGGEKKVLKTFRLTPKWDRVRKMLLNGSEDKSSKLAAWIEWAKSLQPESATDRLVAINKRVNSEFRYDTDPDIWDEDDYWAEPIEAKRKGRLDCEDYAIFKLFLARTAGVDATSLAIAVGKIRSTGEFHAIMLGADGDNVYVLDNRSNYMRDTDTFSDFSIMYAVGMNALWYYPRAYKNN
jgi:predicted transglutaminase-like cysteine proteinase